MSIELLEPRIAPASVLTFTDVDGDIVKVITSHGDLTGKASFADAGLGRLQLQTLDLTDPAFAGADISTVVTKGPHGDGLVNIGFIAATGRDLGKVTISGDLGGIFCGDGKVATGPGLQALNVGSLGIYGGATLGTVDGIESVVAGAIGSVHVRGDISGAGIYAIDMTHPAAATIGSITVGGSLIGVGSDGFIYSSGDIGSIRIDGDLVGGPITSSGGISCAGKLSSLVIKGSVLGGRGLVSGDIAADEFGTVSIGGDLRGGPGGSSGVLESMGPIRSLTIGGSIIGGSGQSVLSGFNGQVVALGVIGAIKVGHNVVGGSGLGSGSIQSLAEIGSIRIGGSLIGGTGHESGKIDVAGSLGELKIGGSLVGSAGDQQTLTDSAGIVHEGQVFVGRDLGRLQVARDVLDGGGDGSAEIRSGRNIGVLQIGGSLVGGDGPSGAQIFGGGNVGMVQIGGSLVGGTSSISGGVFVNGDLGSITVGGSVIGGPNTHTGEISADGAIGTVKIGGNLQGGSLAPGQTSIIGTGYLHGDRIGSIFIGGSVIAGVDQSLAGTLFRDAQIGAQHDLGPITIHGSLVGNIGPGGFTPVIITAAGQATLPAGATIDLAIKSLTVGGRVEFAKIRGGFPDRNFDYQGTNGNASIGAITVGGNWIASTVTAGVQDGGVPGFGDGDDSLINSPNGAANDAIVASIASITIKGAMYGAPDLPFHSGFVAQQIGSFNAGGFIAHLTADTDAPIIIPGLPTNEIIREYARFAA